MELHTLLTLFVEEILPGWWGVPVGEPLVLAGVWREGWRATCSSGGTGGGSSTLVDGDTSVPLPPLVKEWRLPPVEANVLQPNFIFLISFMF